MESLIGRHWHPLPANEVIDLLETNPDRGLDLFTVKRRQEHFGPNVVCTYGIGRVGSDQWQQAASVHPYVVLEGQLRAGGSSE